MPGLKGRFLERRKEERQERREDRHEVHSSSERSGILKSRPLITWLEEREPLIGSRGKLLFGVPRTSPDPLPAGITPMQAVEAVESTSWAKGLAEGVCKATGLTGAPYDQCVHNYKRKVALGALGLTAAQLAEKPVMKRRGPGRPSKPEEGPEAPPTPPTEAPTPPETEKPHVKYEKTEEHHEHWTQGKKHGNWIADIHDELNRGNKVFFNGDPGKSGTKLIVFETSSGNSYISRPLSIQELDYIVRQMKKDKNLELGVYGSPVEGAKKT